MKGKWYILCSELIKKWEYVAQKAWSDSYTDAMYNCINDLQRIVDNAKQSNDADGHGKE